MKTIIKLLIANVLVLSLPSYSQPKKPATRPVLQSVTKNKTGPLNPDDYEYYFLVDRTANVNNDSKPYYTLTQPEQQNIFDDSPGNNYYGGWVVMDVRTGKEVAWWPRSSTTYYSPTNQQLYFFASGLLWGNTASGLFQYKSFLRFFHDPKFGDTKFFLSTDWKKAIFIYNNDVWVADYDIKTGKIGQSHQVTFAGIFNFDNAFMKDDFIITEGAPKSYIIDAKSGKFIECLPWYKTNSYITDLFIGSDYNVSRFYRPSTQTVIPFEGDLAGWQHAFWTDNAQTEYVVYITKNNQSAYYYLNPKKGNNLTLLNWSVANKAGGLRDGAGGMDKLAQVHTNRNLFSPNHHRFLRVDSGIRQGNTFIRSDERGSENFLVLYDIDAGSETPLNLTLGVYVYNTVWADDNHFFFSAKVGDTVDGKPVDTSTQGTYVYDIQTKKATRITPYLMTERSNDDGLWGNGMKMLTFPKANWVVFEANNFLFRCRFDGSEVSMITKSPMIYTLRKIFLDESIGLK